MPITNALRGRMESPVVWRRAGTRLESHVLRGGMAGIARFGRRAGRNRMFCGGSASQNVQSQPEIFPMSHNAKKQPAEGPREVAERARRGGPSVQSGPTPSRNVQKLPARPSSHGPSWPRRASRCRSLPAAPRGWLLCRVVWRRVRAAASGRMESPVVWRRAGTRLESHVLRGGMAGIARFGRRAGWNCPVCGGPASQNGRFQPEIFPMSHNAKKQPAGGTREGAGCARRGGPSVQSGPPPSRNVQKQLAEGPRARSEGRERRAARAERRGADGCMPR